MRREDVPNPTDELRSGVTCRDLIDAVPILGRLFVLVSDLFGPLLFQSFHLIIGVFFDLGPRLFGPRFLS
jgi:hypothetical protein